MTERLISATNGLATTIKEGDSGRPVVTSYVDTVGRQKLLDNAAAERAIHRHGAKPDQKYFKVATIPWEVWADWSKEIGMPLGKMPADERDAFIRKKIASGDYSKLHSRDKV